jgi:hypothetical protein
MHSYDNGTAVKAKKDNWAQLMKIFRKLGLDSISEDETQQVLRCEDGAAVLFVTKLYELLTQRKVQMQVKNPTLGKTAGYAKDTGAWKVKEALRKSNISEDGDMLLASRYTAAVVDSHERSLQHEKASDPDRYVTSVIAPRSSQIVPKTSGPEDIELPQIRVKEIQVKQLDRNITHLRASRHNMSSGGSVSPSVGSRGGPRAVTPSGIGEPSTNARGSVVQAVPAIGGQTGHQNSRTMLPENSASLLNSCIARVIGPETSPRWSNSLEPIQNLIVLLDNIRSVGGSTDNLVANAIREIQSSASELADSCVVTPKQFWRVSDLLSVMLISCPYESLSYSCAVECFSCLGFAIVQSDPRASLALFCDFSLPKLIPTLQNHPRKRLGILQSMMAFSPVEAFSHVQSIKRLQDALSGGSNSGNQQTAQVLPTFISCLTILATLDSCIDAVLLDLYLYYSTIALGMPSPKLRAGGVAVLATLFGRARDAVCNLLPMLTTLAQTDTWWEVHAYLLLLCGKILESEVSAPGSTATEYCASALNIIENLFSLRSPPNLMMWGLSVLAPCAHFNAALTKLYLSILQAVSRGDREYFLRLQPDGSVAAFAANKTLNLPTGSGIPLVLETVGDRWNASSVAEVMISEILSSGSEKLSIAQFQLFRSCVHFGSVHVNAEDQRNEVSGVQWTQLFDTMKDYVFVGLCDPNSSEIAGEIILHFLRRSVLGSSILKEKRFAGVLRMIYSSDNITASKCQIFIEKFLRNAFDIDDDMANTVMGILEQFAKSYSLQFEASNLQSLLNEFSTQLR